MSIESEIVETNTATLAIRQIETLFPGAIVFDEAALWLAWEQAKDAFLSSKLRKSGSQNTAIAYKSDLRAFFKWACSSPWNVSPAMAIEYDNWMATEGKCTKTGRGPLADATRNRKLAVLSEFYNFVIHKYLLQKATGEFVSLWELSHPGQSGVGNPFNVIERVKVSPYGRAQYPSTTELKAILGAINTGCLRGKRDFALLYTIATTCLRFSAVIGIRWGEIQERDDGDFNVTYQYKGGDIRRAVLERMAYQAICAYLVADDRPLDEMQAGDHIFIQIDPTRIARITGYESDHSKPLANTTVNAILKKYARRAGVAPEKAHIHGLRHAGARLRVEQMKAARKKVDLLEIMHLLGHSSLAVTQIYTDRVLDDPDDPGIKAAAMALMPTGQQRKRARLQQETLPGV